MRVALFDTARRCAAHDRQRSEKGTLMFRLIHIPTNQLYGFALVTLAAIVSLQVALLAARPSFERGASERSDAMAPTLDLGSLPLPFEPNAGQAGSDARFLAHTPGGTVYFGQSEVVLALKRLADGGETRGQSRPIKARAQAPR